MSYLRDLCLFAHSDVQHILYCFCFAIRRLVGSFSGLSLFIAPSVFSNVYSIY